VTGLISSSPSGESVRVWPLIGRAHEIEWIAAARAAGASGVVLAGGAGVGKSRLARAALAQAEQRGAVTVWVQATRSAASVPLGAFAGVIPEEVGSDDLFELLRRSAAAISGLAGTRPLVIGIDDAQLLDPTSAALVLHLANGGACFMLVTVRTGEPCPDAIVSLWKDGGAERLELAQLGEREIAQLVESIVGGPVEEGVRRWVWETSRGNPLYVRELMFGALAGGALEEVSGLWRMPKRPPLSVSLIEVISARLAGLTAAELRVLELLALGEPLRIGELVELVGGEAASATEALALISIQGSDGEREVRLSHPLYGETVRAGLGTLRASELRLTLAARVEARGELTPSDSLRVARWLQDAGAAIPNALLLDAARAANLSGDPDLGAELAGRALAGGAGVGAALLLARSEQVRKRFAEAEFVLAGIEGKIESQDTAIAYLEQRVSVLYWGLRRPEEAQALLARARGWWTEGAWLRRVDPVRLHLASMLEGPAGTVAVAGEILADDSLEEEVRHQLEPVYAVNLFFSGRAVEAYELIRRIRPAPPVSNHIEELALAGLSVISLESGQDLAEYERSMKAIFEQGVRAGDHAAAGIGAGALGGIAFLAGRYRDAARWIAEAEVHFEQHDTFGLLLVGWAYQVGIARFTGDGDGVASALARCEQALNGADPLPNQLPYVVRARAWAADAQHDRAGAQRLLLDAAASLSDVPVYAALLHYEALRCGAQPREIAAALSDLRNRCDARLVAAYADHAAALAANAGPALLEAADEFERIGALRYGTEATAHAAQAFLQAGRQDSARRAAARSRELFADAQGGTPPPIEGLDGPAVELTTRETQLVELARQGLTNVQIAERLVLSVRTVESHLYRAMQKLGISDRRQL
jgi:DNA-binding CsgD family transcriptional regulator